MMNNMDKQDEMIRKMIHRQGIEQAPDGFTDKVMKVVEKEHEDIFDRLLDPKIWIWFGLGIAAVAVILLTIGIPGIGELFNGSKVESFTKNLFSANMINSMVNAFRSFKISSLTALILGTAFGLVLIDLILRFRKSGKVMMIVL